MSGIGLFIGAGASCELAMPLVWELTRELKDWLTPEKLRALNAGWKRQGGGYDDRIIEDVSNILTRPNLHYEAILGYLETQFRRNNKPNDPYHGLYSRLIEIVSFILYQRHYKNQEYIKRNSKYFAGIQALAEQNRPLWVFSLNHDILVECLGAEFGIPVTAGFGDETITLPRRNKSGVKVGELNAQVITGHTLERSAMSFFGPATFGINLLKIHGSLDIFTFRNGEDLLRVVPTSEKVSSNGLIECLYAANEELLCVEKFPKVTNEIAYTDDAGEIQFLRRTLLSGAYKYDQRATQVLPLSLLRHFQSNLNHVSTLMCIGYGFGDEHINKIFRAWLEFSANRKIKIINPGIRECPSFLLHLAAQIELVPSTMSDFLDSFAGIIRTKFENSEKKMASWVKEQPDKSKADAEFANFFQARQTQRIKDIVEKIVALPRKNGDIDLEAIGLPLNEFISKFLNENKESVEDIFEDFLKSRS